MYDQTPEQIKRERDNLLILLEASLVDLAIMEGEPRDKADITGRHATMRILKALRT